MLEFLTYLLPTVYTLSIVGIAAVILAENRNPLKTLPWIVVLLLAPGVGLVLYFFFGQNLSKRRIISRRTRKRITMRLEEADQAGTPGIPGQWLPLSRLIAASGHAVPLYGSRLTPFTDGASVSRALLEAIAGARRHIHVQYYILADDEEGNRLAEALMAKAREGVEVRVLYDDVGCNGTRRAFFRRLTEAGVEVHPFLHVNFPHFTSKVNYRNHRKIVVVDGRTGFFGGMNIADRYICGTGWGCWRDTHFRMEGGGVAGLQAAFLSDWSATTKEHPTGETYYPPLERLSDGALQIVASGPFGKWRSLLQADCMAIARARRRVWIQTPYYLPTETLDNALKSAALAGIDVRLMLPARSDSRVVDLASHSYLDDMLRAGVKVLFYTPGFLHAKLLVVDDEVTVVGSANMDFRSFEHNFEISAFVYDPAFNARMATIFDEDARQCRSVTPAQWFRRGRSRRFAESCMRLFAPLL